MKQFKDPFEAAYEEQEDSPPQSPIAPEGSEAQTGGVGPAAHGREDDNDTRAMASSNTENKEDDYEEEEENVEVELSKFPSSADPTKMSRSGMQSIFSQFTDEQMNRYESFRRSALKKSNMRTLLVSITGSQKISLPMTIAVSGIAKLFVGELVETARVVMTERKESGPIRPCHIREAYRRLKLDGKLPKRSAPRLFR